MFEVPDKFKDDEFRYVGIKKKPSALNGNVGQMMISSLDVYGKMADYESAFSPLTVSYDETTKTLSTSFVARTSDPDSTYRLIYGLYGNDGSLISIMTEELSESNGAITSAEYANKVEKTGTLTDAQASAHSVKVFIWNGFGTVRPVVEDLLLEL